MCEGGCDSASAGVFATTYTHPQADSRGVTKGGKGAGADEDEDEDEYRAEPGTLRLRVNCVEGVVETPFDAELVAGLAAVATAANIAFALKRASAPKPLASVVILTDSKTLIRAVRTGPEGNEELARRGGEQRRVVWDLLMDKLARLDALGVPSSMQWTAGHPERRGSATVAWSYEDWAIWEADRLATTTTTSEVTRAELEEANVTTIDLQQLLFISAFDGQLVAVERETERRSRLQAYIEPKE
jgi:hypothetical protein